MFRIFDKNIIAKELFTVNLDSSEIQSVMGGNLFLDHLELNPDDCCVVEQNQEIQYPTYDELEDTVREMTLFERYKNKLYQLDENEIILNNEIIRLEEGQYLDQEKNNIVTIPAPETLLKKVWDRETCTWKEGATEEEITGNYFTKINKYKAEILENGFDFNSHQQKCREKDLALLGNAIAANEDAQPFATIPVTHWSFNDHDVVEMSLDELKKLRIDGATFVQAVFIIEAQLKATQPNILLEKQDFIEKIDELSTVKCFKESI